MANDRVTLAVMRTWLQEFARLIADQRTELSDLDAAIGDGDHGTNMHRGLQAVVADLAGDTIGDLVKRVGMKLVSTVGGASGPLYGTFFLRFAASAGAVNQLDPGELAAAMRAGLDGIVERGKAEPGDKTMLDALAPAVETLETGGAAPLADLLRAAADAAEKGRDATVDMIARKGRASYLGERSVGHQDPGATSAALLVRAAATTLG